MSIDNTSNWNAIPGQDTIERTHTANGITLLCYSNPASKSVYVSGLLACGGKLDPAEKLGLAHFTAGMLLRGTQDFTFQQIHQQLEAVGANLSFNASTNHTWFRGRSLIEDLPMLMEILTSCLTRPTFPEEYIERLRNQLLTGLAIRDQDTADVASLEFDRHLFPNHPYGWPVDGYKETVAAISREDILQFHQTHYSPADAMLVMAGALSVEEMQATVSATLEKWKAALKMENPALPVLKPLEETIRKHFFIPEKSQADIVMGCIGPARPSPDYLPVFVGNHVLGQFGLYGRIGEAVRTQAGLAYYASSNVQSWEDTGAWEFSAGVNPKNIEKTIRLIQKEMHEFIQKGVRQDELDDSVSHLIGKLPLSLESNAGISNAIMAMERFSLGLDYFRNYPQHLRNITREQIMGAARTYLNPERLVIISAGPQEES